MNTCPSRVSVGAVWFVALRFPRGGAHEGGSRAAVLAAATVPEQPQSASSLAKLVYAIDDLCQVVGISRATVYKEIKEQRLAVRMHNSNARAPNPSWRRGLGQT